MLAEYLSLKFILLFYKDKSKFIKYLFEDGMSDRFYNEIVSRLNKGDVKLAYLLSKKDPYKVVSYLKNIPYYESIAYFIDLNDYYETPFRYIKNIIEKLNTIPRENFLNQTIKDEPRWKLRKIMIYTNEGFMLLAYKLYLTFGLNNTLELLNGMYGEISCETVNFMFNNWSSIEKNNQILLNFLFNNKKSNDNVMRLMLSGRVNEFFLKFPEFISNLDYYVEKLGTSLPLSRVCQILNDRIMPNNPLHLNITSDIYNDIIPSYKHKYMYDDYDENYIKKINDKFYEENLENMFSSSIPEFKYTENDITCEVLKKSDPKILVMGYRTNNCFRINGDALVLFKKSATNKHMRVISVSTKERRDIAMMLLFRNGNVLVGQGIEISKSFQNKEYREKIYNALKNTLKEMMNYMNLNNDEIVATIIGNSNANVMEFNNNVLSFRVKPILDDEGKYYDGFNHYQYLLDLKEGKSLNDIKLFLPNKEYYDERDCVSHYCDFKNQVINPYDSSKIFSISRRNETENYILLFIRKDIKECHVGQDWYIILFDDGIVIEEKCGNDLRTLDEIKECYKDINAKKMSKTM